MATTESVINWFKAREGKVTYSMSYRYGPSSYDCSSAVYYALIEAGFLPSGTGIGSTESLYALEGSLLQRISRSEVKRGDIFISGGKGTSGGANGHTGVFVSNSRIIHCNYGSNGIAETPADGGYMGGPPNDFYRLKGSTPENKGGETTMQCFYRIDGSAKIYYYDGLKVRELNHPDEKNVLNDIYKANNGKDMPGFNWSSSAPMHARLLEVLNRNTI